jgi:hypothetical protein
MTNLADGLRAWIREAYAAHAAPAVETAGRQARDAQLRVDAARRNVDEAARGVAEAKRALAKVREAGARTKAEDDKNLAVARSVRAIHSEKNQQCVQILLGQARNAPADQRAELFLTALLAAYDLERMFK